ncbi:hypothetical protein ACGF5M_02980 [Gemmatimonadota bacterium]
MTRALGLFLVVALFAGVGAGEAGTEVLQLGERRAEALPDSLFAHLVQRLSGPGMEYNTDNLVSNERSYLHVIGEMERRGVRGGAFVGVGPDQGFSYIATIEPEVALILDIRRDNLLLHLLYKAIFEASPTRVEFLAHLFGKPVPSEASQWIGRGIGDVLAYVEGASTDAPLVEERHDWVSERVQGYGIPLDEEDVATIRRFHQEFIDHGPDLKYSTYDRGARPVDPSYRQLVLETDLQGREMSFLATTERYAIIREMSQKNRIVPVVGDLAGEHALQEIGRYLEEIQLPVSVLYASNVEFLLWEGGVLGAFVENVAALPLAPGALLIRSIMGRPGRTHPHNVRGYYSTQSLQTLESLVNAYRAGEYRSYNELVTRHAIDSGVGMS